MTDNAEYWKGKAEDITERYGYMKNDLEGKLAKQSEMLALALKEKNDALTKNDSSDKLRNLQIDFDRLKAQHTATHQYWRAADAKVMKLEEELKGLRPAPPKFKIGQIVVAVETGHAYTIKHHKFHVGVHYYSNRYSDLVWQDEKAFREQNNNERGD